MKPKHLQPKDKIMLISPASGAAGVYVLNHRVENGKDTIEQMGFEVVIGEHALIPGIRAGTEEQRAQDIHTAIQNPDVKALISMIGGDHVCAEILPHLDFESIKNNPKIFMGYSDVTSLLLGIYKMTGLTTFYGPAVMTQFAEYPAMLPYTKKWLAKTLMSPEVIGKIESSPEWTDETLDWAQKLDLTRPRKLLPSIGWEWLQAGRAEGKLLGGCIQTLVFTIENYPDYIPDFSDSLFFWESAEKGLSIGHSPQEVEQDLMKLKEYGIFEKMTGMIVGRPYAYNDAWHKELKQIITKVVGDPSKPIMYNVEIGHTDPILTIPIGVKATIDSESNLFSIDESAVKQCGRLPLLNPAIGYLYGGLLYKKWRKRIRVSCAI
jgi:muramoyltetrapeptide carboxypeptidase